MARLPPFPALRALEAAVRHRSYSRAARELNLDRAELRRRNLIAPAEMPFSVGLTFRDGKPLVYASGDFPLSQTRAIALADYGGFRARQAAARAAGRYIGIGIGNYVEGTGLGPFEGVTVRILRNGKVAVATGATTQGQGTHTTLSQIVADRHGAQAHGAYPQARSAERKIVVEGHELVLRIRGAGVARMLSSEARLQGLDHKRNHDR